MPWIRLLISAPPLLLAGLLAVSFVSVRTGQAERKNELAIGVPADPDSLNPILMTTQGAANVTRLVFNGLIRFDENLEPAPDLAESWEQRQTSIITFPSPDAAANAARMLEIMPARWPAWALTRAAADGNALRLDLATPGTKAAREIQAMLDPGGALARADRPEITFHLRKDARWHDGEAFTAQDVEFTWRAIMDAAVASPRRSDFQLIESLEVVDARTVRVVYRQPHAFALNAWTIGMLPRHLLADRPAAWWAANFNRRPVGTGPFRFAEWQTNEQIVLARNAGYFRGPPHLDRIVFRIIPDRVAMRIAFQTRQIDLWETEPSAAAKLERDPRFEILSAPSLGYTFIGWNLRQPTFQDRRVRQALAHAIDADAIIRHVIEGRGRRATGPFTPAMSFFDEGVAPLAFDPDRARQLLAEAGWRAGPDGVLARDGVRFHIDLVTNNDNPVRKDIATLAQADLRKIGVEVEVRAYEAAVFIAQVVHTRAFDGLVLSWMLRNDPDQYPIWHSSQAGPRQLNIAAYSDPRADALLDAMRTEYDPAALKPLAAEFQRTVFDDQPYAFLYTADTATAMWRGSFRVRRPVDGAWRDEPVRATRAGVQAHLEWFHR